jgi:hypothetical protein
VDAELIHFWHVAFGLFRVLKVPAAIDASFAMVYFDHHERIIGVWSGNDMYGSNVNQIFLKIGHDMNFQILRDLTQFFNQFSDCHCCLETADFPEY